MASKSDFNEDEWKTLVTGFTGVGFLVSTSDQAFGDMFKETKALAKYLTGLETVGETQLVRELATNHKPPFGMRTKPDEIETQTLAALRASAELLAARSPEDHVQYAVAVVAIAEGVANAAKGISADEAAALAKIREAVGAPTS